MNDDKAARSVGQASKEPLMVFIIRGVAFKWKSKLRAAIADCEIAPIKIVDGRESIQVQWLQSAIDQADSQANVHEDQQVDSQSNEERKALPRLHYYFKEKGFIVESWTYIHDPSKSGPVDKTIVVNKF